MPYVITSKALGDAVTPPASDRIVMGGIGLGNMSSGDQRAFLLSFEKVSESFPAGRPISHACHSANNKSSGKHAG